MALALIKEVASAQQFFSLKCSEDPSYNQMAKNFANALIQQVNSCLALSLHDGPLVIHALKDSPYVDADIKRITAAIDAKMMLLQSSKAPPDTDKFPWPTISNIEVKVTVKDTKMDADLCGIPLKPKSKGGKHPAPMRYENGVIYTDQNVRRFYFRTKKYRSNHHVGQQYSTVSKHWGKRRTRQGAWDELIAIATIQKPKK
jgi:hypothetical protein